MGWNEVLNSLLGLYDFALNLGDLVGQIISLIPKIFELIAMLADPSKLIKDAVFGIKTGIYLIFNSILDLFFGNLGNSFKHNFENDKNEEKEACVKPTFLEVIILVLCPPLAIFIRKGMKGFLTILITTILTCFYYLTGVLFASLHIL